RFVLDDVRNFAALDRRQLDEASQCRVARKADGYEIASDVVTRQECFQSLLDQLARNCIRLTENLRMRNVVIRDGQNLLGLSRVFQADGFQPGLPQTALFSAMMEYSLKVASR
ncbi:MAG: hypothetical protein O3B86_19155, partial [Planctomycetota bacterium]|nr:hypothetical protein [Planctomycetota bacterium]